MDLLWETMDKNSSFELELLCWQMLSVKGQITIIFGFAGHMSLSHTLLCIFYLLNCKKFCQLTDGTQPGLGWDLAQGLSFGDPCAKL